ncbi:MAG TPA: DUF2871 family protein, partial [Phycisphaerae bacterium]|nr:DUF2871 family protein [Phycisphaerae bacterium]
RYVRALLKYALIMLVVSLLAGVAFQESSKKLPPGPVADGFSRWDATMHLALVHGHTMMIGVLVPVALAGMLHLARAHGAREVSRKGLAWTVGLYVPFSALTVLLMLYKGYHVLLSARFGKTDPGAIDAALFAGSKGLRHGVYGLCHVAMAVGLFIFVWCLWRSMGDRSKVAGHRSQVGGA